MIGLTGVVIHRSTQVQLLPAQPEQEQVAVLQALRVVQI